MNRAKHRQLIEKLCSLGLFRILNKEEIDWKIGTTLKFNELLNDAKNDVVNNTSYREKVLRAYSTPLIIGLEAFTGKTTSDDLFVSSVLAYRMLEHLGEKPTDDLVYVLGTYLQALHAKNLAEKEMNK